MNTIYSEQVVSTIMFTVIYTCRNKTFKQIKCVLFSIDNSLKAFAITIICTCSSGNNIDHMYSETIIAVLFLLVTKEKRQTRSDPNSFKCFSFQKEKIVLILNIPHGHFNFHLIEQMNKLKKQRVFVEEYVKL